MAFIFFQLVTVHSADHVFVMQGFSFCFTRTKASIVVPKCDLQDWMVLRWVCLPHGLLTDQTLLGWHLLKWKRLKVCYV